jgi:hypothetical protein
MGWWGGGQGKQRRWRPPGEVKGVILDLERSKCGAARCQMILTQWFYCREIDVVCELIGKDGKMLGVSLLPSLFFDG